MPNTFAQSFLDSVPWDKLVGARYTYVAFKGAAGLQNLVSQLILEARMVPDDWTFECQIGDLRFAQGWMTLDAVKGALADLGTGILRLDNVEIQFTTTEPSFSWGEPRTDEQFMERIGWPSLVVHGHGGMIYKIVGGYQAFETLGKRLPAATPRPFSNWEHVARFLGMPGALTSDRMTTIDIALPTFARIDAATVDHRTGDLTVVVEAQVEAKVDGLAVVITAEQAEIEPVRVALADWSREKDDFYKIEAALPPDLGTVRVQLVANGEVIEEVITGSPPLAVRAHAAIDTGSAWLKSLLGFDGKLTAGGFEHAVTALLALAGIPAVPYGFKSGTNFPDVVAAMGNALLVCECTIDAPSLGKIQTLASRADSIRKSAEAGEWKVNLLRLLFTPRSMAEIPSDVREAAEEDLSVAILGKERLAELFEMVQRGEDQQSIWFQFLTWVSRYGARKM